MPERGGRDEEAPCLYVLTFTLHRPLLCTDPPDPVRGDGAELGNHFAIGVPLGTVFPGVFRPAAGCLPVPGSLVCESRPDKTR